MFAAPLRDVIPSRTTPFVTVGLIALSAAVFIYQQQLPEPEVRRFFAAYGLVPGFVTPRSLLTSLFLHGGWFHLLVNMLFLWIFGDTVEDRMGHGRFAVFYVLSGTAAGFGQLAADPHGLVPMVGATGAVAGVIGAYFTMFPSSRVLTLVAIPIFYLDVVEVPAVFYAGLWFLLQLLGSADTLQLRAAGGATLGALAAGFLAGAGLGMLLRRRERLRVEWGE
ncbi:MAG TPA: rhomboid family intramembrane serine protease [Vicinamibacterales bacterium]|nr:rhomboid family intramembrane serine protease [Vicinamibacterales bacterium]